MEWLKMSPEYRVHTAVGNDGYKESSQKTPKSSA